MRYYVMKTGMEMFDANRVYGLGLVVDGLGEEGEVVVVRDFGPYYLVEGPKINSPDTQNPKYAALFDTDPKPQDWTFLTLSRNQRGKKIEKMREILRDKITSILKTHEKPTPIELPSSKGETLYQSMDPAATKGYRVSLRIKEGYSEGSNVKVPPEEWALAVLGEIHFTVWRWLGRTLLVSSVPRPERVRIDHWRGIQESIQRPKVNRTSTLTVLAHTSIFLAKELRDRIEKGDAFVDRFSSFIYSKTVSAAQQRKPAGGGAFSLDFLYRLINSDLEAAGEIFEIWNHVFRIGSRKGREDISLCLSDFIAYPTRENLERYNKVHLRYLLRDEIKIRAWPENCVREVMKNVRD